jgi:urease beta subunit/subtilisin-like proprotein convertase family protein
VTIADVTQAEGQSGTTTFQFTVSLSTVASEPVTVQYGTTDGTAAAGSDYTATSGTLTIPVGQTSGTITVAVAGDALFETNETFSVNLSNGVGGIVTDAFALGTITNDDTLPMLSIGDASILEGNAGTTLVTVPVTLDAPAPAGGVTVQYATVNGSATTAGGDYSATSGTLVIPAGSSSGSILVTVLGDGLFEANETLDVILSNPIRATLQDASGRVTILNDDAPPQLSVADASRVEGNAGSADLVFLVTLDGPAPTGGVSVAYATLDGSATTGDGDYQAASGTLVIPAGATQGEIRVPVVGDLVHELDESLTVQLASPVQATILDGQADGSIVNDDALPRISIADATVFEGDSGTAAIEFAVTLDAPAPAGGVTVDFSTHDGSATSADNDYLAASGSVTFLPGETQAVFEVAAVGDTVLELDETLQVTLFSPVNATILSGQATGTIQNDDSPRTISVGDASIVEGHAGTTQLVFTVSLSAAAPTSGISVDYATQDGTATIADGDYLAASGTLVFAAGQIQQTVSVDVVGDDRVELDETLQLVLTSAVNGTIQSGTSVGTIVNDDVLPTIAITDASIVEGDAGTTQLVFTLSLDAAAPSGGVAVDFATQDGTATTADGDYAAAAGTVTFAPGSTQQTVTVDIAGDDRVELDETFQVVLSNAVNGTVPASPATGTIVNDDALRSISVGHVSITEGDAGATQLVFTLSLDAAAPSGGVAVDFATQDGTATTADGDYVAASGTVTFAPGTTQQSVTVDITGDDRVELDETFRVVLSNAVNGTVPASPATGTIVNDDVLRSISVSDASIAEGDAGTTQLVFTVSLNAAAPSSGVTVRYATANGTATAAGNDYQIASGVLTFLPGETQRTVSVAVVGDRIFEANETLQLSLTSPVNATLLDALGVGTIVNDDIRPAIRIADVTALEGNVGVTTLVFPVTLSSPALAGGATVRWTTADSTATLAGADYVAASGTLAFAEGEVAGEIRVDILGDTVVEATERVSVRLSAATNATIGDSLGVGNLVNDDLIVSVGDVSVVEGSTGRRKSVLFPVTLSAPAPVGGVAVTFATADGTAVAPSDYTARQATQTIAAGLTSGTLSVTIQSDRVAEFDETLLLNLVRVTNAILGNSQGVATIVNDDAGTSAASAPTGVTGGTGPSIWLSGSLVAAALPLSPATSTRQAGQSREGTGDVGQFANASPVAGELVVPAGADAQHAWLAVPSPAMPASSAGKSSQVDGTDSATDGPATDGTVLEKPISNRNAAVDAVFATL